MSDILSTRYGVAVGLFKDKKVYLSRRSEKTIFPKKWQFVNGRMKGAELSHAAAVRIVEEHTGIILTPERLHDIGNITVDESGEFYYVYLVHLQDGECPINFDNKFNFYGNWRAFSMESSIVLDLVPGLRNILRKLYKCLMKIEGEKALTTEEMIEANKVYDEQEQRSMIESGCYGC